MLKFDLREVGKEALDLDRSLLIDVSSLEFIGESFYHLGFLFNDLRASVLPVASVFNNLIHEYWDYVLKLGTEKDGDYSNHV